MWTLKLNTEELLSSVSLATVSRIKKKGLNNFMNSI